jgi:molybdate transport system ATP-binding protein
MSEDLQVRLSLKRDRFDLDVDLRLPGRGITVLFGPSGSGKTTVLRAIAGLERVAQGRVAFGDQVWQNDEQRHWTPTWQRGVGMVFQEASLFDHLNVAGNMRFGWKRAGGSTIGERRLAEVIDLLGLRELLSRRTQDLSGGERQRVAIARALGAQPRLLLLDEPLSALDLARKREILPWLERLKEEAGVPMVYVTHSAEELARLADQVVILHQGRVQAQGPLNEVMTDLKPSGLDADEAGALLQGTVVARDPHWHLCRVEFPGGSLWVRDGGLSEGRQVRVRILARDVSLALERFQGSTIQNLIPGTLEAWVNDTHPSQCLVRVRCGDSALLARITARSLQALNLQVGQAVWVQVKAAALVA